MFICLLIAFLWNCSVYSGTVAGAREAFFNGLPSVSISYDWYVSTCIRQKSYIYNNLKKKKKKVKSEGERKGKKLGNHKQREQ